VKQDMRVFCSSEESDAKLLIYYYINIHQRCIALEKC